jgi:hypothetical protein
MPTFTGTPPTGCAANATISNFQMIAGSGAEGGVKFDFDDHCAVLTGTTVTLVRKFTEPGTPELAPEASSAISDMFVLELTQGQSVEHVSFYSDPADFPIFDCTSNPKVVFCYSDIDENGDWQTVIPALTTNYQIRSDVDEPPTILLLLMSVMLIPIGLKLRNFTMSSSKQRGHGPVARYLSGTQQGADLAAIH